jgi:glycosyltransferase 2 family protein
VEPTRGRASASAARDRSRVSAVLAGRPSPFLPRHPGDLIRLATGLAILAGATAMVHRDRVGMLEANLFRLVNDLPGFLFPLLWAVMQAGNLLAVPVLAALAAATRRFRLALDLAVAGTSAWMLAKLVKLVVARGRPPSLLDHVIVHGPEPTGQGYVSGHAAVAVAMATVASPYMGRRARRLVWVAALLVCVARMYVGAHLPLDVVGGAALGWAVGALVQVLLGAPGGRPTPARVVRELGARGIAAAEVVALGGRDAARSARFLATTADGERLFVKLVPRERRNADLLYRAWRRLVRGAVEPRGARGSSSPPEQVEREAYLGLLAAHAGVNTPGVVLAEPYGNGGGLLVQRWVAGRSLDELGPGEVGDELLEATCREVGRLHGAGIAHGDLTRAGVLVGEGGRPWLVDFDHAEAAAPPGRRDADVAELLASLAVRFGAKRAVAAATAGLGAEPVARALAGVPRSALTEATRRELRDQPALWDGLRAEAGVADPGAG